MIAAAILFDHVDPSIAVCRCAAIRGHLFPEKKDGGMFGGIEQYLGRMPAKSPTDTAAITTMNPLVTKVHAKEKRWSAEYAALRRLCLAAGLNEELKWGQACYDLNGGNVVLIHGFKNYCALLFMKGALLKDPKGILIQQTKNVQAARQIRFASLADINQRKALVKTYIEEAIAVEKSGAKVKMRGVAQFDVPEEFLTRLDDDPELAEAFHALTPGRQKGYLLHFAGAKQSATRTARVEKHAPRIVKGLGLDD
jgi:uncharacterized protein YdeI (YjbR/CyaY-like superfamily)